MIELDLNMKDVIDYQAEVLKVYSDAHLVQHASMFFTNYYIFPFHSTQAGDPVLGHDRNEEGAWKAAYENVKKGMKIKV